MHAVCTLMPNTKPFVVLHAGCMAESENIASQIGLAGSYQYDQQTTRVR